jgi:hypothetical protein
VVAVRLLLLLLLPLLLSLPSSFFSGFPPLLSAYIQAAGGIDMLFHMPNERRRVL